MSADLWHSRCSCFACPFSETVICHAPWTLAEPSNGSLQFLQHFAIPKGEVQDVFSLTLLLVSMIQMTSGCPTQCLDMGRQLRPMEPCSPQLLGKVNVPNGVVEDLVAAEVVAVGDACDADDWQVLAHGPRHRIDCTEAAHRECHYHAAHALGARIAVCRIACRPSGVFILLGCPMQAHCFIHCTNPA